MNPLLALTNGNFIEILKTLKNVNDIDLNSWINSTDENGVSFIYKAIISSKNKSEIFKYLFDNFKDLDWFYCSKNNLYFSKYEKTPDIINLWSILPESDLIYFFKEMPNVQLNQLNEKYDLLRFAFRLGSKEIIDFLISEKSFDPKKIDDITKITEDIGLIDLYGKYVGKNQSSWFDDFYKSLTNKYVNRHNSTGIINDISTSWDKLEKEQKDKIYSLVFQTDNILDNFKKLLKLDKIKMKNWKPGSNFNALDYLNSSKTKEIKALFDSGFNLFEKNSKGELFLNTIMCLLSNNGYPKDYQSYNKSNKEKVLSSLNDQFSFYSYLLMSDFENENLFFKLVKENHNQVSNAITKIFMKRESINFEAFWSYTDDVLKYMQEHKMPIYQQPLLEKFISLNKEEKIKMVFEKTLLQKNENNISAFELLLSCFGFKNSALPFLYSVNDEGQAIELINIYLKHMNKELENPFENLVTESSIKNGILYNSVIIESVLSQKGIDISNFHIGNNLSRVVDELSAQEEHLKKFSQGINKLKEIYSFNKMKEMDAELSKPKMRNSLKI